MSKRKNKSITASNTSEKKLDIYFHPYFHYIILFSTSFLLFGWTISFNYNLDDELVLSNINQASNSLSGIITIFKSWFAGGDYRPVTILSFWIERLLFTRLTPGSSHFVNVLLFGIILIQIYRLVIISKFIIDDRKLISLALITSLLFLIHPNHVSVVANIKSRDNILSMLFGLSAALQFIRYYDNKNSKHVLFSLLLFLLALLSKRDAYSLLFYPILILILFRSNTKKNTIQLTLFTLFIIFISSIIYQLTYTIPESRFYLSTFRLEETPILSNDTFTNRISLALTTFIYYIKFLFIPFGYHFYFGYNQIPLTPVFSLINTISLITLISFIILSVWKYKTNRVYLFCLIFYLISIAYALNFFTTIAGIVMDRYNFIASLAFCLAVAMILIDTVNHDYRKILSNKIFVLIAIFYIGCTLYRTSAWKDRYTLFDRDLKHLKNSVNANRIAGGTYIREALLEEEKNNFNKPLADSFINKGERYILNAIKIYDNSAQVWEHLGLCELYRKNYDSAISIFRHCYNIDTTYLSGINYLGFSFWNAYQFDSAIYYFNYVIKREPFFGYSANNLINLYIRNNRLREADSASAFLIAKFPNDIGSINKRNEVLKLLNNNRYSP